MNSPSPSKTILKTTLNMGSTKIPVRLYRANDRIGLSGQLFHDGCNGKIRQWKVCEDHPNTTDPATFSGIQIADVVIPIDQVTKRNLLFGDCNMDVVCTFPMKHLSDLMSDGIIVPCNNYQIAPEEHFEDFLGTLLDRLRINKSFMLVYFPEGYMRRYGIIFPSGAFMSILYEEEIREKRFVPGKPRPDLRRDFDKLISQYKIDSLPQLTGNDILQRVEAWYSNIIVRINKQRSRNKAKAKAGV